MIRVPVRCIQVTHSKSFHFISILITNQRYLEHFTPCSYVMTTVNSIWIWHGMARYPFRCINIV
ncbi:hypothetical protein MtrunA17_Chr4g0034041 [Medicago truncatula]|uniref:Uncharacterized protein n=1 Tax=Medicago truncatula TaxID=3880 RepID=A0A396I8Y2_MEDTR|nr:hypothetical protein MtrunA17_Chr4g0034041 [Medicago truncatula]